MILSNPFLLRVSRRCHVQSTEPPASMREKSNEGNFWSSLHGWKMQLKDKRAVWESLALISSGNIKWSNKHVCFQHFWGTNVYIIPWNLFLLIGMFYSHCPTGIIKINFLEISKMIIFTQVSWDAYTAYSINYKIWNSASMFIFGLTYSYHPHCLQQSKSSWF